MNNVVKRLKRTWEKEEQDEIRKRRRLSSDVGHDDDDDDDPDHDPCWMDLTEEEEETRFRVQEWRDWVNYVSGHLPSNVPSEVIQLVTEYCRRSNDQLLKVRRKLMESMTLEFGIEFREASGEKEYATEDHILQLKLIRYNLLHQIGERAHSDQGLSDLTTLPCAVLVSATPQDERGDPHHNPPGTGWAAIPHLYSGDTLARLFVVITPLRTRDFSAKLAKFSEEMRRVDTQKHEFVRQQISIRERRAEVEKLLHIQDIRDEERLVPRCRQFRPNPVANELYDRWLSEARQMTSANDVLQATKSYSIHLLPDYVPRTFSLPSFDGRGWVRVDASTTFEALIQYLKQHHADMELATVDCMHGYSELERVLSEVRMVFRGRLRVSSRQTYWYERTPQVRAIIQVYETLVFYQRQLNDLADFSNASHVEFLVLPPTAAPTNRYRLENDILLIPAHFSKDDFSPPDFAEHIIHLVPQMRKNSSIRHDV